MSVGGGRDRFASVVRERPLDLGLACALIGTEVDRDLDVDAVVGGLDELATPVARDLAPQRSALEGAAALRRALAERAGFRGTPADYADLRGSLLHEVLRRRTGLPILLSVVYLEVGRRAGLVVEGVGVPGHFVVAVDDGAGRVLIDPYAAGADTTPAALAARVAELNPEADTGDLDLDPWDEVEVVRRVLGNIRALATGVGAERTQLWAIELSLLLPHHPATLRRDRAHVLARLGEFAAAAAELEQYADVVGPVDPETAERSLHQARLVRSRLS